MKHHNDATDKKYLVEAQYFNENLYNDRMVIFSHGSNPLNQWQWLAKRIKTKVHNKNVLEIGSGNGLIWQYLLNNDHPCKQLILSDLSEGILSNAKAKLFSKSFFSKIDFMTLDCENIPFNNNSFDLVLAHNMLYHLKDPKLGLNEIARTLTHDGFASISLLGTGVGKEMWQLAHEADNNVRNHSFSENFNDEKADKLLPKYFQFFDKETYENKITITEPSVLVRIISTFPSVRNLKNHSEFLTNFKLLAEKRIKHQGYISFSFNVVHYICRRGL